MAHQPYLCFLSVRFEERKERERESVRLIRHGHVDGKFADNLVRVVTFSCH